MLHFLFFKSVALQTNPVATLEVLETLKEDATDLKTSTAVSTFEILDSTQQQEANTVYMSEEEHDIILKEYIRDLQELVRAEKQNVPPLITKKTIEGINPTLAEGLKKEEDVKSIFQKFRPILLSHSEDYILSEAFVRDIMEMVKSSHRHYERK